MQRLSETISSTVLIVVLLFVFWTKMRLEAQHVSGFGQLWD